jgi:hypothetical protein
MIQFALETNECFHGNCEDADKEREEGCRKQY